MKKVALFPEQIKLRVSDKGTNEPAGGIVAEIRLFANRKNDYFIYTEKSKSDGTVIVNKQDFISKIEECRNTYIMDYYSNLEDCKEFIEISIPGGDTMQQRIKALRSQLPEYPENLRVIKQLEGAANSLYHAHRQLNYVYGLPVQEIEVVLEKI